MIFHKIFFERPLIWEQRAPPSMSILDFFCVINTHTTTAIAWKDRKSVDLDFAILGKGKCFGPKGESLTEYFTFQWNILHPMHDYYCRSAEIKYCRHSYIWKTQADFPADRQRRP